MIKGIREARDRGAKIGRQDGQRVATRKSLKAKEIIRKHSRDFAGTLTDREVMTLAGVSKNSFYKYKKELRIEAGMMVTA